MSFVLLSPYNENKRAPTVFKTHQVSKSQQTQVCHNFKNELRCDCRTCRLYFVCEIITCTAAAFPAEQKSCRSAEVVAGPRINTGRPRQQSQSEPGGKVIAAASLTAR